MIKISINVDTASLARLQKNGVKSLPYHRFLTELFQAHGLTGTSTRLDRIERNINKLKREIAA